MVAVVAVVRATAAAVGNLKMLKTVNLTFLSFMAGYVLLLIAFALSFYVLFRGSCKLDGTPLFSNLLLSFLKIIVMFSGEYEASNLSFNIFKCTSHVIFLSFVVFVELVERSGCGRYRCDSEERGMAEPC